MLIAIIILAICVLVLYAKVSGLENALSNHLEEPLKEAHPQPEENSFFETD